MLKNKIFRTIVSLISLGAIAKLLSTIAKIISIRMISAEALGLYAIASSSLILFITLVQLGLPPTITKLVAKHENKRHQIIASALVIVTVVTIILTLVIILGAPYFAKNVLKNADTLPALYAIIPLIPLIGYGSILKAYYVGINKIEYTALSQISEEVMRILFLVLFASTFNKISPAFGAMGVMLGMAAGEVASILHLLFFTRKSLKKRLGYLKSEIQKREEYMLKEILPVSLSLTTGRLISSLTYFVEPIILTNILLGLGYSTGYISIEYARLATLAMPLLLLPGFFTSAFSSAMLPIISKDFQNKHFAHAKKICLTLTGYSALIGTIFALICFFFPELSLTILYGNSYGAEYVRFIAFPFILYYIQAPLSTALLAIDKEKSALRDTIIGSIIRIFLLVMTIPTMKMYGVALATIVNVFIVTTLHLITLFRFFARNKV